MIKRPYQFKKCKYCDYRPENPPLGTHCQNCGKPTKEVTSKKENESFEKENPDKVYRPGNWWGD